MKTNLLLLFAWTVLLFGSCSDDDNQVVRQSLTTITLTLPADFPDAVLTRATVSMKNITSGKTTQTEFGEPAENTLSLTVNEGLYDISLEGEAVYAIDSTDVPVRVKGYKGNVQLTGGTSAVSLPLFRQQEGSGFVFAEIYFTGSLKSDGKTGYISDKYFRIYNNSDSVLYADGLAIAESAFTTTQKQDYSPDIMAEAMAVQTLYRIPGNGKDHPVEPGKSILICDVAKDHSRIYSTYLNLEQADFEWYDESSSASNQDEDTPAPNLDKIYSYSKSIWTPANQGNKSFALIRPETDHDTYLKNYKYDYFYISPVNGKVMTASHYKIPNIWIVDAVNLSPKNNFKWIVTAPSLDQGYTGCADLTTSVDRFGKSVRRKVESTVNGRIKLKDTNNSTVDFESVKAGAYH